LEAFSIALDDSTDASDTAQLAIFIRGVDADLVLKSQFNNITLTDFYKFYLVEEKYTNLRAFSRKISCLFGSTYIYV
jgi:hypothetical protein